MKSFSNRQAGTMASCLILFLGCGASSATEYFVNKQGLDANSGQGRDKAFLTIQKGVTNLLAGDTLTIGPGEYAENVKILNFGSPDKDTLIRAEMPGTVLLRGDVDAPAFTRVSGRQYVHAADYDGPVLTVNEVDTVKTLKLAAGVDALDISPGSYFYDAAAKKLYISSSDFQPSAKHHYTICIRRDHGFLVNNSQRIVIDGLAASGFMTPIKDYVFLMANSGFMVIDSKKITIRRCTAFFNHGGITLHNGDKFAGGDNIVENSRAFGNAEGIACYYPNNTIFRDSVAFLNEGAGINFYAGRKGNVLFSRNLAWGNRSHDFHMKGAGLSGDDIGALAEHCIGLNKVMVFNLQHCIVGGENESRRGDHALYAKPMSADNIALPTVTVPAAGSSAPDVDECLKLLDAFKDREFADPVNFDFRLQGTSQFRQAVSNAPYSGAFPYQPDIYYVTTNGSDQADGHSLSNAWNTLGQAFKKLKPGDTLYIAGGRYACALPLSVKNVKIRGRGLELPVIDGAFSVVDSAGVALERLQFTEAVRVEKSSDMAIDNCVFAKSLEAVAVQGLNLTHGVLAVPLVLKDCAKVYLSGNIFAGSPGIKVDKPESIIYSAYNSYADAANCRKAGGKKLALAELQNDQEAYSRIIKPDIFVKGGIATVCNAHQFLGRGPLGSSIGLYREWAPLAIQVDGPKVHSVSDTTANIEWWTSLPAHVELLWGDTPQCTNSVALNQAGYFSYSLIGLEPGKKYYVKIKPTYAPPEADPGRRIRVSDKAYAEASFRTDRKAAEAKTYYVSTNGNDSLNGLSRETAWKSLQHAADTVRPGDTILVGAGEYKGTVYFPITGEKNRPITIKAVPGEKAQIVGGDFTLNGKHYYNIDSLYFGGTIIIRHGSNLQVSRCLLPEISAVRTPNILVKNCAFFSSWGALNAERCPNLRIENNIFFSTLISHMLIVNAPDEPFYIVNNIFGESTRGKQYGAAVTLLQVKSLTEGNNCFDQRWPENERNVIEIWELSAGERKVSPLFDVHPKEYFVRTLPEYCAIVRPTDSFAANPLLFGGTGTKQGWGPGVTHHEFDALFSTSPELIKRGIGLQPEAFRDFHFKMTEWPYDVAWADKVQAAKKAAAELVKAGKDSEAMAAYTQLATLPMRDRMKSEFLENAAMCANRLKQYDQAIAIAATIPIQSVSARCQMKIMVDNAKYAELIAKFADKPGAGTPVLSWSYPEQDDLLVEAYNYRAIAYAECNDLKSAEEDLKTILDAQTKIGMFTSKGIQDMAWVKLGDFYRKYLKDDSKALEAYNTAISRTFINVYGNITPKPVLLGNSETLSAATKAASEILRSQGKETEALKLQFSLLVSQGNALGILDKKAEASAKFKEAMNVKGITVTEREECERKIDALEKRSKSG